MKRISPIKPRVILFLIFLPAFSLKSVAQIPEKEYLFKLMTTENGLSNNSVFDTHQDMDGYMWFATNNGLNRYDGYSITSFFHSENDPNTLASNVVRCIIEDDQGQLWIATKDGLNRFNKGTQSFEKPLLLRDFGLPSDQVMSMQLDSLGSIWMTIGDHIGKLDPESLLVSNVNDFNSFMVNLTLDEGNLWISNTEGDIYYYETVSGVLTKKASDMEVNTMHYGICSHSIWISSEFQDSTPTSSSRYLPRLPRNVNPKHFVELDDRIAWVGTDIGLFEFDFITNRLFKIPVGSSALSQQIRSLYKDPDGGIWVGTLGGVFHYDPYRKVFNHSDLVEEMDDIVMALHADENGIYANALAKGLYFKPHQSQHFIALDLPEHFREKGLFIWDMETVAEHKFPLWLATNDGVYCLNPKTFDFQRVEIPLSRKDENTFFSILNGDQDFLWVASHRAIHKVSKEEGTVLDSFSLKEGIEYPGIQKILAYDEGIIVATENQGLFKFNLQSSEFSEVHLKGSEQIFGSAIWDVCISKNTLWIGANSGLYKLDSHDLSIESVLEDHHAIFSIEEDASGMLWLGSDKGIKSYDPRNQKTKNYTTTDGLKNIEFNRKSVIEDPSGNLWFGGVNGITSFNPERVKKDNPNAPRVHITALRVATSDSTFSIPKFENGVTLSWEQSTIELDYVGLSYTNARQNKYRYTLAGHDPNRVTTNDPITARYVKLPAGSYTFKVNAANSDGIWNTKSDELQITIDPPYWRTNAAYLVYVLSFLGLLGLFKRLRMYRKRITQVEQEKVLIARSVEEKFIVLNNKSKVYLKELKYIKAGGNYLEFHTTDKTLIDRNQLKVVKAQLPPNFIRTHRSYIVNKNYISSANSSWVYIKPDIETPLSRSFKGSLK